MLFDNLTVDDKTWGQSSSMKGKNGTLKERRVRYAIAITIV